jgi:hypothetical protein
MKTTMATTVSTVLYSALIYFYPTNTYSFLFQISWQHQKMSECNIGCNEAERIKRKVAKEINGLMT